jgi:hypothetical protein
MHHCFVFSKNLLCHIDCSNVVARHISSTFCNFVHGTKDIIDPS